MLLTLRDQDILSTVTEKVRLLDEEQLASTWWGLSRSGRIEAKRRAAKLIAAGLLRSLVVLSRPLPSLDAPVLAWSLGQPKPDIARAAGVFQLRWSSPPRSTSVYLATPKATSITGGVAPGLKHPLQVGHDCGLTSVYLRLKREQPALAKAWLGEDCISWPRGLRVRRSDAVIRGASGETVLAVEMGGSGAAYGRHRLEAWHEHFASRGLPYLMW